MRVAADEMIRSPGVTLGVADGVELVFGEMAVHGAVSALSTGSDKKERIAGEWLQCKLERITQEFPP